MGPGLTDADGAKVAREERLTEGVDVGDELVEGDHYGQSTQDHHAEHEDDEAPDRERRHGVRKFAEGQDGADVDEGLPRDCPVRLESSKEEWIERETHSDVEEQVNDVGEVGFLGLLVEEPTAERGSQPKRLG